MLWHDMFNRINPLIAFLVNILRFDCTEVLKTLKNIDLIFTVHFINRTSFKRFYKFTIIRKSAAV